MDENEARNHAIRIVGNWRFCGPRDSTGVNPRIILEHNDHWDLVDAVAEAILAASEGRPPGIRVCAHEFEDTTKS